MKHLRRKNSLNLICLLVVVLFLYTFGLTSSRYVKTTTANQDVLAIPILDFYSELTCQSDGDVLPGDTWNCFFSVTNAKEEYVNEVLLNYYFDITLDTNIPLNLELYDITENNNEISIGFDESVAESNVKKSNEQEMNFNKDNGGTTKNYRLDIIWDAKDNDYIYASNNLKNPIIVKVNLVANQVVDRNEDYEEN